MSGADLLEDGFPHGTVEGYRRGCKSTLCAGLISCRDVYTRYQGDYSFKNAIDAGTSLEEILRQDAERLAGIRERDRTAARHYAQEAAGSPSKPATKTATKTKPASTTKKTKTAATKPSLGVAPRQQRQPEPKTDPTDAVLAAHGEGLTDQEIADRLLIRLGTVVRIRRAASLLANLPPRPAPGWVEQLQRLHAGGATDREIADELGVEIDTASRYRRKLKLPVNRPVRESKPKPERPVKVDHTDSVLAAHAEGLTDQAIAERLQIPQSTAARIRRSANLPANVEPRPGPTWAEELRRLHSGGATDREIAEELGVSVDIATRRRRRLQLEANRIVRPPKAKPARVPKIDHTPDIRRLHELKKTDAEIGAELGIASTSVGRLRRILGLPANRAKRPARPATPRPTRERPDHTVKILELHEQGMSDVEIGDAIGLSKSRVGALRRQLELPAHFARKNRWEGAEVQPCGTNASFARGCHCDACGEAHRIWFSEYMDERRALGVDEHHHGTAYGYQLGCKDRDSCPATPTCRDATLEEERRRRREAGVPEQEPRVPAGPVLDHVRALMSSGMQVLVIAEQAAVSVSTVKTLLYGRSGTRKGERPAQIKKETADRLLQLQPTAVGAAAR